MTKKQILVVEEESIMAQDIKMSLEDLGYTVPAIVSSGEEAVKEARKQKPDLVLMDIILEGEMNGIDAAEQIRSRLNIPIVYLTAYVDEEIVERAKITKPYGYILKPFEDKELHTNIEIALYRHKMQEKLRENEEWFSATLRSIGDAVIATDTEGRIDFMNPSAQSLTGWNQQEATGKPLEDVFNIVSEKTDEKVENPVTRIIREGVVVGLGNHTVLIAKDGTRRFIDDSGAPIRDDSGNVTGVILVFRDVTERRQREKALAEKNRLIRMLMENIPDQVYIKDREHRFIMVNEAGAENLDATLEEVVGKTDADFFPEEMAEEYYEDEESVMKTGKPIVNKEERTGREGERWNSTTKIPMYDESGNIAGIMGINRDITERKEAEEALREREQEERRFQEKLTALHGVSNELSKADSFDELCRNAIELGRNQLGFDRLGLWFIDEDEPGYVVGSFGTDENGQIRDERDIRLSLDSALPLKKVITRKKSLIRQTDIPLVNHKGKEIGQGSHAVATLWDGETAIGALCMDNLFTQKPITVRQFQLLTLYASTLGHLCSLKKAEEKLRTSEEKYRQVVENANEIILVIQEGKIEFFNSKATEISGYSEEEIISKPFIEFIHPDDREMVAERHKKRLKGEDVPSVYSLRFIDKEGNVKWVEINVVMINWKGEPATLNFLTDITERKRTEEELRKSEERFRRNIENIFRFVPEGLLTFTDKLNLFRTNKAFKDIVQKYSDKLNYTEEELTELIIEQVKDRIVNEDYTEIRIPKKQNEKTENR